MEADDVEAKRPGARLSTWRNRLCISYSASGGKSLAGTPISTDRVALMVRSADRGCLLLCVASDPSDMGSDASRR